MTDATGRAPQSLDRLRTSLRAAGLRSTAPRQAVLRQLLAAVRPVSHAELYAALEGEGFDRTTVYRNLLDLAQAGLAQRIDLGDHVWRFEQKRAPPSPRGGHVHFTCTDCGTVSCLDEVKVKVDAGKKAPRAIARRQIEVQLRGQCDACA